MLWSVSVEVVVSLHGCGHVAVAVAVVMPLTLLCQSCPRVTFLGLDPTRPDPTRQSVDPTRPAIADEKSDPTQPDPTRPDPPYVLCFMSSTFKLPTGNNMQLLHDFEGNNGKYFSSGLVMFPEGEKNDLEWF